MVKGLTTNNRFLILIPLLGIHPLFAQSQPVENTNRLAPIFTLLAGASMSQMGESQTMAPIDLCTYTYKPNHKNSAHMLLGGFIGSKIKTTNKWAIIAGVGYYEPFSLKTRGALIQGADLLSAESYNYHYHIKSQQVLVEGKWYWTSPKKIQPFFMLGIGAAFNKAYNFQTTVPHFVAFTPNFSNHTQTNFTYALGPGFDMPLNQEFNLGFGYRFTDLGTANTGKARVDTIPTNSILKQSNLYANQVFAQITFIPR